ncbi:hypothetical protein K470DRAFT_256666 [Piedraia hortae CBS 480.64]|uniref:Uncharacterized protein n=1 Tax=Piedraia hortae CBS 480.64 TaxID=1314780 RepID=A0A6A7C547_9PEZI|nr:hypothetical protein K470DRAFT_256666 [Piedraia hortae CBS 480.64]
MAHIQVEVRTLYVFSDRMQKSKTALITKALQKGINFPEFEESRDTFEDCYEAISAILHKVAQLLDDEVLISTPQSDIVGEMYTIPTPMSGEVNGAPEHGDEFLIADLMEEFRGIGAYRREMLAAYQRLERIVMEADLVPLMQGLKLRAAERSEGGDEIERLAGELDRFGL